MTPGGEALGFANCLPGEAALQAPAPANPQNVPGGHPADHYSHRRWQLTLRQRPLAARLKQIALSAQSERLSLLGVVSGVKKVWIDVF